ncbi:MAG: glycosyltransferase [bacterium]
MKKVFLFLKKYGFKITLLKIFECFFYSERIVNIVKKKFININKHPSFLEKKNYNYKPQITIIVPNYNHEKFLKRRLDSIYSQKYENYNVILLDDNSSDESRKIILDYTNKYKDKTIYIFNTSNSGSVFNQWKKGIEEATGDLIWIAESDDYCTDNFISSLVPFFYDESIMIAYCRSVFVKNNIKTWDIESYLADIDKNKWKSNFIETANEIVNIGMAKKNIIPNMSSVIFRNPRGMKLLNDEKWKTLRFCGDWIFYLHIMRGGAIAYTTEAINYFRQHSKNTSTNLETKDIYYTEHEYVSITIAELYPVSPIIFDEQNKRLQNLWKLKRKTYDEITFRKYYNIDKIKGYCKKRKPNVAIFGYSFSPGGGETFPIFLANILYDNGYGITFIDCNKETRIDGIRKMLKPSIPVLKLKSIYKIPIITKSLGIKILHSHHAWVDSNINKIIEYMPDCKHLITLHGMYEMMEEKRVKTILPNLYKKVDHWVYTTDKNIDVFKKNNLYNKNKFTKIGNALVRYKINKISKESLKIDNNAFVFCLVSRSIPEKGWEETIQCIEQARLISKKDIQLIIIGDGNEKDRLQQKPQNFIHFLGFKSNIRDYYAMSNMGILPSRFKGESFPLTIIDCLFAGKPVLASNIGEIEKMLNNENKRYAGCLFNLENWKIPKKELTELIIKCTTDINFYNRMLEAVKCTSEKFDIYDIYLKYDSCYKKMLN